MTETAPRRARPLALYMEGSTRQPSGKMGFGVLRYATDPIACVIDSREAGRDAREVTRIPRSAPIVATLAEAEALGAEVLVLGIAPPGGRVPEDWWPVIDEAVARGLSVVNGLHDRLAPRYPRLRPGQEIHDLRVEPDGLTVATGAAARLPNRRVVFVGTDMAVGKMSAALEVLRVARERGVDAAFVATGQIGIAIAGRGVALDAVRLDYACGAIEREVLAHAGAELVLVEGQGSLVHPASAATLPLLRGAMPTHLVLCARAGQAALARIPGVPIPPLRALARSYEDLASTCGTFPGARTAAVALNTFHLEDDREAAQAVRTIENETGLPCCDPVRHGAGRLLDALAHA
ncbi:MAG: DUF1611 domain-containing protein [Acidobacteria bacterium]|nr:DUF1611 domain-containing protein [Acidobacteriota bacterium]